ncbi:MAG: glutamate 5-kinase [Planctomycetota bacterium]|jgi:glutamate 5-kinase
MPEKEIRQEVLANARRIVVKVGTGAICDASGRPERSTIASLAKQIAAIRKSGVSVLMVSSGAIGAGLSELELVRRPKTMPKLQAAAAVGQGQLMRAFHDVFARYGVKVAQVLLTRDDLEERTRYLNIRNTLQSLEDYDALPIINENDTVAVDEIRFGDNDIIAAQLTNMVGADVLVLLTMVDGVMKDGTVLDAIEQVDESALALDSGRRSGLGSGGLASKLEAAALVTRAGEVVVVANARTPKVLLRLLAGERIGTVFLPARRKMSSRRRWIGQVAQLAGKLIVDEGAAKALTERGKSLLASGITAVAGEFPKGATVAVIDSSGNEIARGLTNYSAQQIRKIKGLKSSQIARALGDKPYDEVIHRNNMTVG